MAHQSEDSKRLRLRRLRIHSPDDFATVKASKPAVWVFILPYEPSQPPRPDLDKWYEAFKSFAQNCHEHSVVCFVTTPESATILWPHLEHLLHFKLWVTLKLKQPLEVPRKLSCHHAALLILTKYRGSLRHTKTRIGYTYCAHCDRTTKDYGGKKHTYHRYGTLMSDVWRDISCYASDYPIDIITRLRDLFGLEPYKTLHSADLRSTITSCHRPRLHSIEIGTEPSKSTDLVRCRTLLNGDCLDVVKEIPSNTIDFCFADPPYNLKKKYDNWDDDLEIREYFKWCDLWLCELARVLKPGRTLAVLNLPLWAIRHFSYLRTILDFQNWIVWEGLSLPVRMIMPANYAILCFSKGQPRKLPVTNTEIVSTLDKQELYSFKEFYCIRASCIRERELFGVDDRMPITDLWWDIHRLKHNSRRADHPCQLPPALMRRLIALFTYPNECVLDPFNGVGTTTLAAEQLDRFFVGIEISKTYHKTAERRHTELRQGLNPFRKRSSVPRAKNSPVPRLKKQMYAISKKELQLEVKRIASELGRLPNREEVKQLSKYPISYYDDYFISWGEVCAAARTTGMSEVRNLKLTKKSDNQLTLF